MSPVRAAALPRGPLYRLGWMPDPTAWAPWDRIGDGRFDDPRGQFRVLYAASQRRGVFIETLAGLRPSLEYLAAAIGATAGPGEPDPVRRIPTHWFHRRGVARLRLSPGQRWLDLRSPETREALRTELAPLLIELGLTAVRVGSLFGTAGACPVVLRPSKGQLQVEAQDDETGEWHSEIEASVEGEPQAVALNALLIGEVLDAARSSVVELNWLSSQSPVVIREASGTDEASLALVMPLYLPSLVRQHSTTTAAAGGDTADDAA